MKVFIGADHRGFAFKQKIVAMLEQLGHKVVDLGTYTDQQPCDYPDIAKEVGEHVAKERDGRGILVCMSGIGLTIAANKVKGVYAALCYNLEAAELSRLHNNANVLVLSSKFVDEKDLFQMLEIWMTTNFEGGRHLARVKKIMDMEEGLGSAPQPKVVAPAKMEDKPSAFSRESVEKVERLDRRESPDRERPRSSDREGRPAYTTRKPPFRKAAPSGRPDESKSYVKKSFVGERSYARPERSDSRGESRPSYASRRPDSRTGSDRGERPAYSGSHPSRDSRPRSSDRDPRRDEGRPSYGSKPSYGTKKPYASERSYAKPAGRSDSRSNDARPSYASRRPDGRGLSERQRPAYAKDRPNREGAPARGGRSDRPPRMESSERRGPHKTFSSGKPKFSPKPGGKTFAGKKKFSK